MGPKGRSRRLPTQALLLLALLLALAPPVDAAQTSTGDLLISPARPLSDAYQQPALALDPVRAGHLALAYQEGTHFNRCYLALSADSGASWKTSALVGVGATHALPRTVTHCQNPMVSYAADGTLYYGFQDSGFRNLEPDSIHVLLMTSNDGGATFADPRVVDPSAASPNDWYPALAPSPDGKRLYFAWTRYRQNFRVFPGYPEVASSTDRGRTFSPPVPLLPIDTTVYVGGPVLSVAPDGRVYVAFIPSPPGPFSFTPGDLKVAYSGDQGASFAVSSVGPVTGTRGCVQGVPVCRKMPVNSLIESLAAGPTKGQVFIAWFDDRGPDELARISFAMSRDGGVTWSTPRIVGIPSGGDLHQQHRPQLAVAADDHLYLAYYDLAPDGRQDVLMISSVDGGATFNTPRRLNSVSYDATIGPGTAGRATSNLGSHLGLVATDSTVFAAWTDGRRGTLTTGHQDVAMARVEVGAPRGFSIGAILLVGVVLLLIGGGIATAFVRRRRRNSSAS